MNNRNKKKLENLIKEEGKAYLLSTLRTGENRGVYAKECNYRDVSSYLSIMKLMVNTDNIDDAVTIIKKIIERELEAQEPIQVEQMNNNKLKELIEASSGETNQQEGILILNISVRLDNDQLKHQHPSVPIGTRIKGGGNRFIEICDVAWHQNKTMPHMADWANGLANMNEGEKRYHGQATPVEDIHYEGYCLMAGGKKYVLFHCYPSNDSQLNMSNVLEKNQKKKSTSVNNNSSNPLSKNKR